MGALYSIPYTVLEVPNLKIKRPSWFHQPSAMVMFSIVLASYFLVTGGLYFVVGICSVCFKYFFLGIIYDVIVEPPSVGSTTDEHGHSRPVTFF